MRERQGSSIKDEQFRETVLQAVEEQAVRSVFTDNVVHVPLPDGRHVEIRRGGLGAMIFFRMVGSQGPSDQFWVNRASVLPLLQKLGGHL